MKNQIQIQEYQEKPISKGNSYKYDRERLRNRTREEASKSYGSRRWGTSKKIRDELAQIYTPRNGMSFKITLSVTPSNNSLARKKNITLDNIPSGMNSLKKFPEKGVKVQISDTCLVISKFIAPIPPMPPAPLVPKVVYRKFHGVPKDFKDFTPWDWKAWHRNRGITNADHARKVVYQFKYSHYRYSSSGSQTHPPMPISSPLKHGQRLSTLSVQQAAPQEPAAMMNIKNQKPASGLILNL